MICGTVVVEKHLRTQKDSNRITGVLTGKQGNNLQDLGCYCCVGGPLGLDTGVSPRQSCHSNIRHELWNHSHSGRSHHQSPIKFSKATPQNEPVAKSYTLLTFRGGGEVFNFWTSRAVFDMITSSYKL